MKRCHTSNFRNTISGLYVPDYVNPESESHLPMKKFFSFLTIIGIIIASNCSRIPENNDPVIGIWSDIEVQTTAKSGNQTIRQEWIFNDAYLGRYHSYTGGKLEVITDFGWSETDGLYTITYPGLERENDIVKMTESKDQTVLQDIDGNVLAIRE